MELKAANYGRKQKRKRKKRKRVIKINAKIVMGGVSILLFGFAHEY